MPRTIYTALTVLFVLVLPAFTAHADTPQHLTGVWEGLATAESNGRIYREYVAFDFLQDGTLKMANAREPRALQGKWTMDGEVLKLTLEGRPGATLDQLQLQKNSLKGRLGYGQGRGVNVELHRVGVLPEIPPLVAGTKVSAADVNFDGLRLGDSVLPLHGRRLYAAPCDEERLPDHRLRVVAYGGQPCRGQQFEKGTSAIIFTDLDDNDSKNQAIRTVAWLGGTYFHTRSNFPLRVGQQVRGKKGRKKLAAALKQSVVRTMPLKGKDRLTVTTFSGGIHLLDDGKQLVGVVLGPMPQTTKNKLWGGVLQLWEKYTVVRK